MNDMTHVDNDAKNESAMIVDSRLLRTNSNSSAEKQVQVAEGNTHHRPQQSQADADDRDVEVQQVNGGSAETGDSSDPNHSTATATGTRSISELAELTANGWNAPKYLNIIERFFRMSDPSHVTATASHGDENESNPRSTSSSTPYYIKEATGWAMDSAARGPMNQIGSYIGSAILLMAAKDSGCINLSTCTVTTSGLKPSSLLTLTSSIVGVVAAILMPVMGAIVDHTPHRKLVAVVSGFVTVLMTGLQIGISAQQLNWLYILILDAIQSFALLVHTTAVFAYLPDLTLQHKSLPAYMSHFNVRQYISQFSLGSFVIIAGTVNASNNPQRTILQGSVLTARVSAILAFGYGCVLWGYAWTFLFRNRPALSQVPQGSNLLTTGFQQVYRTTKKISRDYKALRWFVFSLLWSPEAGAGVVLSIAVTFLVTVLHLTTLDIAKVSLILMTGNIVGSYASPYICSIHPNFHPLHSYRVGMSMLGVSIAVSAAYLDNPTKLPAVFGFAIAWGFFMGWTYPCQRVLFVTLIPKGQETEYMGCFFFAGQILGWLPPLLFTVMNQNNVNMRYSFGIIAAFCWFAVLCTLPMGNYHDAVDLVARDSHDKFHSMLEAASRHDSYSSGPLTLLRRRLSAPLQHPEVMPVATNGADAPNEAPLLNGKLVATTSATEESV